MRNPLRPVSRRAVLRAAVAGGGVAALNFAGMAQPPAPPGGDTGAEFITADTQAAIDRGLTQIAQSQADDGSFSDRQGGTAAGITGLCGLALLGAGHQPGRGRYGKHVSRAVDYVLKLANGANAGFLASADGQFGRLGNQPAAMYSHGFASLFLAEVCGMMPEEARQKKVRETLRQATTFSVAAQNKEGGWRYQPRADYADVSVTVALMMALRGAHNAGEVIQKKVVQSGAAYIRGCQMPDGGFSYFRNQGFSAFARSAAAVSGLFSAGVGGATEDDRREEEANLKAIDRGLRYLQQFIPGRQFNERAIPAQHYYYGQYYAALAMWMAGGDYWRAWFPAVRDELLGRARAGGGVWADPYHGNAYATAMSLIVLQLPNNYLPILQK